MKVLSLFDGMACGMIAMQLAGMEVESYDAYEIDKYAIKTAQHNFPMIKEHGNVFDADFTQYEGVDFLIGGSPCTYWSIAQTKNRETVASGMGWELFSRYVRALHEAKPKYFIYENNKSMSKAIRASIDKAFGFEAVLINSALVSAQNRQRLYWVGKRNEDGTYSKVNVEQPADRGILLKDVLDSAVAMDLTCNDKSYTLTASYDGACAWNTIERHQRNMVAEPLVATKNGESFAITANYVHIQDYPNDYAAHTIEKSVKPLVAERIPPYGTDKSRPVQYVGYAIEFDDDGKPIKAIGKDGKKIVIYEICDGKITIKGKQYPIKLKDGYYIIRKLTVRECMRLQTVPEWYEFPVSNTQAYKMLGNGWTVDVIAHILRGLKEAYQWMLWKS
jgi:DNA (cytosine-5)-methyltransferase 3A